MSENSIDDFTLHCVEMIIKELISQNDRLAKNVVDERSVVEYLIFENRKLVLYEALNKVQELKITRKEYLERLKEL